MMLESKCPSHADLPAVESDQPLDDQHQRIGDQQDANNGRHNADDSHIIHDRL